MSRSYFLMEKKTIRRIAIRTSRFKAMISGMYCDSFEGCGMPEGAGIAGDCPEPGQDVPEAGMYCGTGAGGADCQGCVLLPLAGYGAGGCHDAGVGAF